MKDRYLFRGISVGTDKFVMGTLDIDLGGNYRIDIARVYENTHRIKR